MDETEILLQTVELLSDSEVMVAVYDEHDRLRFANRAFRAAWSIADEEQPLWPDLMRRNFDGRRGTIIATEDFDAWLRSTQGRRGKSGFRAFETDLHDGRWLWMTETVQANGWMLCIASDITAIGSDERTLRQDRDTAIKASQTDDLTGIASRRYVMAKLSELVKLAAAEGENTGCVAVIDVDNFKQINDQFGHASGDLVLRHIALVLQTALRKKDVVGRVGGEEFLLLLPKTSAEQAQEIVEQMLVTTRRSSPLPEHPDFKYTFSAGIASAAAGDDPTELYRRADLALYGAKLRGRNQVTLADSSLNEEQKITARST